MDEFEWNPGTLLATSGQYWQACAMHTGVKLEIFSLLAEGPLEAAQLAHRAASAPRSTTMLLNALSAMGLVVKSGDSYTNTAFSQQFLNQHSDDYLGHIILHHHHLMASWAQLPDAVRRDHPVRGRITEDDETVRRSFLLGMFNLARLQAPRLAETLDLSQAATLLDLGGGPGTYAVYFCRANPRLTATVFDLPTTRPFARDVIERYKLADRIRFVAGDYHQDHLDGEYDVIWLSHILHAEGLDACQALINKAAGALASGGQIIIHDFLLDDSQSGPLFPALFALNMLLGTAHGQTYSHAQVRSMLRAAGMDNIRRIAFQSPNEASVLVGTRYSRCLLPISTI